VSMASGRCIRFRVAQRILALPGYASAMRSRPRGASTSERSNETRIAPRAVLRRREGTCFSSPSDDEVGALQRRDPRGASTSERSNETRAPAQP
jgi:hypothetical protein